MSASIQGAVVEGKSVALISIQVQISRRGLPRWRFSGRAAAEVREGKERILRACRELQLELPRASVHIGLLPGSLRKKGTSLDLPIALAVLQAHQFLPSCSLAAVGEVDFLGKLHSVQSEQALVQKLLEENKFVILPYERFAQWKNHSQRKRLMFCETLQDALDGVRNPETVKRYNKQPSPSVLTAPVWPVSSSLLTIATLCLVGGHHALLLGPPGVGKSYVAELLRLLLPPETDEAREKRAALLSLYSIEHQDRVITVASNVSKAQLFGTNIQQGIFSTFPEVLFMDELPEHSRDSRESLRQCMEITPLNEETHLRTTVVATANPCPCGYSGTPKCRCRSDEKERYSKKISGPLLDRFSLIWQISEKDHRMFTMRDWEAHREKLRCARERQLQRSQNGFPAYARNYGWEHIQRLFPDLHFQDESKSFRRLLFPYQVAQTLADWNGEECASAERISEARQLCQAYSEV